jgi:hypothetical protein
MFWLCVYVWDKGADVYFPKLFVRMTNFLHNLALSLSYFVFLNIWGVPGSRYLIIVVTLVDYSSCAGGHRSKMCFLFT